MKKALLILLLVGCSTGLALAQETPNFSLMFQGGGGDCSGFLGNGNSFPVGGIWLGVGLSNRWEGLWGLDYYSLPSNSVTIQLPSPSQAVSTNVVQPSDDIAFTVNMRWYWADRYDDLHHRFNTVPYFVGGFGLDLVADQFPRPPNTYFYSASYDALFGLNLGGGVDFPLGDARQWIFYWEAMDHLIAWQGLTQIYSVRVGLKIMLDTAHVDPFRGIL